MSVLLLLGGFAVLVVGADLLVRGASSVARRLGITPLVIGLTVVAFGTSAPEAAVSVQASLVGQADIAIGNVVGSNLFNILLILGVSSLVSPLVVGAPLVRRDIPVLIGISLLVWWAASSGSISQPLAAGMLLALIGYTAWIVRAGRVEAAAAKDVAEDGGSPRKPALPFALVAIAAGLGLLVVGADWLVDGAVAIARDLGVSELVIASTIIAAGTSLPELATSVVAAARGQRDIAVGNIVGSNIFNLLGVLGAAGIAGGAGVAVAPAVRALDLPLMVGITVLCWPLCRSGFLLTRGEGGFLILGYLLYLGAMITANTGEAAVSRILVVVIGVWLGFGLFGGGWLAWRSARRAASG